MREHRRVVSKPMGRPAYALEPTVRSFGSLERAPCCPIRFLNSTDNTTRLLSLESPTPCARTYADCLSESSAQVTLVAEAALGGHIGERQPVIAQLFLGYWGWSSYRLRGNLIMFVGGMAKLMRMSARNIW